MPPLYLDNAATSFPKPDSVHQAYDRAIQSIGASPGRGGYAAAIEATRLVYDVRRTVATFFGVSDSSRVVFTHGATESINVALYGLLRPGDRVVTTSMEHNAVARPLTHLGSCGVEVEWVQADRQGVIDPDDFARALSAGARLAVLNAASNVTGTIQPVAEIASHCLSREIPLLVDASQLAGSLPIDMDATGIDILAAPAHKGLLGHPGTGILIVRSDLEINPLVRGGTGSRSADLDQPRDFPDMHESGTPNLGGIAALGAGIDFLNGRGIGNVRSHELDLCRRIRDGIGRLEGITIHGPADPAMTVGIVSFTHESLDPSRIAYLLDQDYGIAVRGGLHCAPLAHRTIGTYPSGTVRVSPGCFTTVEEVDRFIDAMEQIVRHALGGTP